MLTLKTKNPVAVINNSFNKARQQARDYIMQNCFWSKSKYYRKMNGEEVITERENEVIAEAYKKFIHEPLSNALTKLHVA